MRAATVLTVVSALETSPPSEAKKGGAALSERRPKSERRPSPAFFIVGLDYIGNARDPTLCRPAVSIDPSNAAEGTGVFDPTSLRRRIQIHFVSASLTPSRFCCPRIP